MYPEQSSACMYAKQIIPVDASDIGLHQLKNRTSFFNNNTNLQRAKTCYNHPKG